MVEVFRVGTGHFDDITVVKTLTLPSEADEDTPISFHDEAGNDYVVPANKRFIALQLKGTSISSITANPLRIGESASADSAIVTNRVLEIVTASLATYNVIGYFTTGKFITAETDNPDQAINAKTLLVGLEISVV